MGNKISLKRNYIFKLTFQVLSLILPLVTAPYVSRVLGAEGVGRYSYASSVVTYFTMFAALGTVTYGTREIAAARDDRQRMSNVFWGIELMTVGTTMLAGVGWLVLTCLSGEYKDLFFVLFPSLLATAADISWLYTGLEKVQYTVTVNMICKVAGVCAVFVFVKDRGDLLKYALIMSATTLFGNLSMWLFLPKYVSRFQIKMLEIGRHFRETLKYFITSVAVSIYTVLDKTMIGIITHDATENGYYEQACKIVNIIKPFAFSAVDDIMGPRMSYLFANKRKREITDKINFSLNINLMLSVGCSFGLMAVAKNFVPFFFGTGYEPVVFLIQLMAPIIIIICISHCFGSQYFVPAGKIVECTKCIIVGSITNLILNAPLILLFGARGAVVASLIAEGVITVLFVSFSRKGIEYSGIWQLLYKKLFAGAFMLLVCSMIERSLTINPLATLLIQVVCGATLYIFLLALFKDRSITIIWTLVKKKFLKLKRSNHESHV